MQGDDFVCVNCFEDPGLVSFIRKKAVAQECSFCLSQDRVPIAAAIDDVSEYFLKCLNREYDLAGNILGWIGSEGGWFGTYWYAEELASDVIELEFPRENQDKLLPLLFGEFFDQDWCEANGYGLNDQELAKYSWDHFSEVVKNDSDRRFFSLDSKRDPDDPEIYSPGEVLRAIFEYAQEMGLFKEIPIGTQFLRARREGCEPHLGTPEELGPPSAEKANQSNRMSRAGIPMFYGCDEEATALIETASGRGYYAIGRFETLRSATVLDLTAIPAIPSLFDCVPDSTEIQLRRILKFLHHIAREVSRPIERGDREHVEYVPTQVVTEFIREQVTSGNSRIDGIKYWSAVHPNHASYVLFANQGSVEATSESQWSGDVWLRLTDTTHMWVDG